jgi:hypothetical protein
MAKYADALQDLVGPAQLFDLALQQLEPSLVIGGHAAGAVRRLASSTSGAASRLCSQSCRRSTSSPPTRAVIGAMFANHAHGAITHLRRKLVPVLLISNAPSHK